ncbi:hypothetical protein THAOC_19293 [Thalassiosira oceanica]|uniref:Uncharacterized protein n=1 Tax=Thalassiosira oceanica TaxID=159749 RepID=K0S2P3_THAOC|nr:hypothetical protein THAOC_19293 [Thalassiosira oceanica]|eukprot:EJK60363.1 hypothetical protein THAOC_19293 [Thalassiosira oceanica]
MNISCFFSHSVLGLLFYWAGVEVELLEVFNKIFLGVFLATWASANMWFLHKERLITSKNFGGKRRLDEMKNKEEDEGSNEERTSTLSNLTLPSEDEENFDWARDRVDRHFEPMGKDQRKNRKIIYFSVFLFGLILFIAVLASIPKGKKKGDASKNSKMQQGSGSKGSSNVPAVAPKNSLAPTASPGTPPPPCVDLQVEIRTDELGGQTTWELLLVEAAEVVRERPHADGYFDNRRRGLSSSAGPGGEHAVSGNSGSLRRSLVELVARGGPYPDAAPGSLSGAEEPSYSTTPGSTGCAATAAGGVHAHPRRRGGGRSGEGRQGRLGVLHESGPGRLRGDGGRRRGGRERGLPEQRAVRRAVGIAVDLGEFSLLQKLISTRLSTHATLMHASLSLVSFPKILSERRRTYPAYGP